MKQLLIISFSDISSDARVLKQVQEFSRDFEVTTCSYGQLPIGATRHLRIPDDCVYWAYDRVDVMLHQYRHAYWTNRAVRAAQNALEGSSFDVVLANDLDTVPLALSLDVRGGVHADLHEYAPRERDDLLRWRIFVAPFRRWLCRTYLPQCASVSTVGPGLAAEYQREFGVDVGVVMNATPPADLPVRDTGSPIRLVHSGACLRGRQLELMIDGVLASPANVTLDFYLTRNDAAYLAELRDLCAADSRITIHDPVPYEELVRTLAEYDVGVFVLPPSTFSYEWALPNKLFDFVQARLGMVVSPSPEMAGLVRAHGLGAVAADYTAEAFRAAIEDLDPQTVDDWKRAADRAADQLSAPTQVAIWRSYVDAVVGGPALEPELEVASEPEPGLGPDTQPGRAREPEPAPEIQPDNPRPVEVIIACHSAERPLARAVASVVDGSGDVASVTVVAHNVDPEELRASLPERLAKQVRFQHLADGVPSPSGPFRYGIEHADAPWVAIMGSDDQLEPGAVAAWLAQSAGVDALIPRLVHDGGAAVRTPPVRALPMVGVARQAVSRFARQMAARVSATLPRALVPGPLPAPLSPLAAKSSRRRDAVRDRLYYRSAPLGLLSRELLVENDIPFIPGLTAGGDLRLSSWLWSRGRVAVQRTGPAYVIGADAGDRVTMRLAPLADELQHMDHVWDPEFLATLTPDQRQALGTKYLRIHFFGAAYYRAVSDAWAPGDRAALADAIRTVLAAAPGCELPLSIADRRLLAALQDLTVPDAQVNSLALARRRFGRPTTLVPQSLRHLLHREAPLRFMIASALVH